METVTGTAGRGLRWYNAVWRWHFYAGLFCMPFVLWLSVTGTLYLWKPQIEAWQERGYDHLVVTGTRAAPNAIVAAALAGMPGATLGKYQLPGRPDQAVRVLVTARGVRSRAYVDPYALKVLGRVRDDTRLMPMISRLHGTLLSGKVGSWVVEIAACWTITMLLTGLYLWWPRGRGLAGVLYPRWRRGQRLFWRDTHAVAGIWVSLAAIFLIATGLPWANAWGSYLSAIRVATGASDGPVDWAIAGGQAHAEHRGMAMPNPAARAGELNRVVASAARLDLAPPVMVAPPKPGATGWSVASEAANRPLRTTLTVDGAGGSVTSRRDFAQRHWVDRAVGYGIAIHEGAFFGLANQILGTIVTALLATLSLSGFVMWWRRRRPGTLGAPKRLNRPRYGWGLVAAIGSLGVVMPLFGTTLLMVLGLDRLTRRRA